MTRQGLTVLQEMDFIHLFLCASAENHRLWTAPIQVAIGIGLLSGNVCLISLALSTSVTKS